MLLNRTVAATTWPVSIEDARAQVSADGTELDAILTPLIKSACEEVGEMAGRVLSAETWTAASECFAGRVKLPKSPITAVTALHYYDADGTLQAADVADFNVYLGEDYSFMEPKRGQVWPTAQPRMDAVRITFTAGYAACPFGLVTAARLMIGLLAMVREGVVIGQSVADLEYGIRAHIAAHKLGWAAG